MRRHLLCALAGAACWLASPALQAQDLAVQGGLLRTKSDASHNSFGAALSYTQPMGDYLAASLSYLNEGHPPKHHRDGVAGQLWLRSGVSQQGWSFGAGAGLDFTFDTARIGPGPEGYTNDHGWAPVYSLQATWHDASRWYAQVQLNRVTAAGKEATTSLLAGVGYRFDGVRGDKLHLDGPSTDDTVTLLAGQNIVNSFESERSKATSLEYRRALGHYVDWTVSLLNEGTTAGTRRAGVASQLWLIRSLDQKVELGMGAGPYAVAELHDVASGRSHWAGLVSIAGRYHFSRRVVGELAWNRVVTDYHRDADMLLLGLGMSY